MRFRRPPGSTELLLVRHGESEPMVPGRPFPLVDGHGDPELAPDGRRQAELVGARLARHPIDAIYVTTLRRTVQTAAPLAATLGLEPIVEPRPARGAPRRVGGRALPQAHGRGPSRRPQGAQRAALGRHPRRRVGGVDPRPGARRRSTASSPPTPAGASPSSATAGSSARSSPRSRSRPGRSPSSARRTRRSPTSSCSATAGSCAASTTRRTSPATSTASPTSTRCPRSPSADALVSSAARRTDEPGGMTYAGDRVMLDADSHVMELPDFLSAHADPGLRDVHPAGQLRLRRQARQAAGHLQRAAPAHEPTSSTSSSPSATASSPAAKGYEAIGAFDPAERTKALDLLGFERQFVFATFSPGVVFDVRLAPDVAAGAARAHNRAMAEFCADDPRLRRRRRHRHRRHRRGDGRGRPHRRARARRDLDPAPRPGRPLARPRRPRPLLGQGRRGRAAGRAARRRAPAAARQGVHEHRPAGARRLARRRRERARQGHDRAAPRRRAVRRHAGARRRARAPPRPAPRRHRARRRLGAGDAAPPRPGRRRSGAARSRT